ncbi:MAG: hypothetical protein Q7K45_01520 [Nanoarchaeota archaeon]|nr:hypothetical protein [Nanoarchaeota archaeon]
MTQKNLLVIGTMLFTVMFLVLIIPSVSALGLAGQKIGPIDYKPGFSMTNHYSIIGTDKPVEVSVDGGGVFQALSVSEIINNEFDLIINFPADQYVPPGSYFIGLTVKEVAPPEEGISSQVAVSKNIEVIVYSYDKDIQASLSAPNINQGKNITFNMGVQSMGYPNIDEVYARINILNSSRNKVGMVETERKPLAGLESLGFSPSYDSHLFPSGNYYGEALVFYDGKYKTANTTFLIGVMDLVLHNYTSELYPGFNEFEMTVSNGWGNGLRNVYAKLLMNDAEIVQTPSIDLSPWQQGLLKAIVNIEKEPGMYNATLQLHFEGEQKEVPIQLTVLALVQSPAPRAIEKELQIAKVFTFIPAIISAVIILIVISIYLLRRKRKTGNEI